METIRPLACTQHIDHNHNNYHNYPTLDNPISDDSNLQFIDNNLLPDNPALFPPDNYNPKPRHSYSNPSQVTPDMAALWAPAQSRQNRPFPAASCPNEVNAPFDNPNPGCRGLSASAPPPPNCLDGYCGCL